MRPRTLVAIIALATAIIATALILKHRDIIHHFSSFSGWDLVDIAGTFFVAAGCLGELWLLLKKIPESEEYAKLFDAKKHLLEKLFVGLVAAGVSMELFALPVSLHETAKLGEQNIKLQQQIDEAKTNIDNVDPRNLPISYMYATALLQVKGTQFNDLTNWNPNHVALIRLCQNDVRHIPSFDWLDADTYKRGEYHNMFDSAGRGYAIRFQSWGFLPGMGIKSKVKDLDDVNLLQMEINFLPLGAEITGGGVELVANNLHKVFAILPQTDTNFPDGTPGFPYVVLATNWDKEMK